MTVDTVTSRTAAPFYGGPKPANPPCYLQPYGLSTRQVNSTMAVDQLSTTFAALADPTRRAILARLARGEATVNELAEPFPITLQAVSKHLKVLERAGLIARGRSAQLRPSRLEGEALREVADWLAEYRQFWEDRFDRLDHHLRRKGSTNG
jgi:DNA-binding transcriptional ArsR family regulator